MDFLRRIKLFGFGFIIGMIILIYILGKRGCKGINHMKVDELISQYTVWSPKAECKRKALGLEIDTVFYKVMAKYRVNYDKSKVRAEPCGIYRLEPVNKDSAKFELTVCDCDTISKIEDIDIFDGFSVNCDSVK